MHLADAFIQSHLHCIQSIQYISSCIPWESNSWSSTVWATRNAFV